MYVKILPIMSLQRGLLDRPARSENTSDWLSSCSHITSPVNCGPHSWIAANTAIASNSIICLGSARLANGAAIAATGIAWHREFSRVS